MTTLQILVLVLFGVFVIKFANSILFRKSTGIYKVIYDVVRTISGLGIVVSFGGGLILIVWKIAGLL